MWHLKRCLELQPLILSVKTALQLGQICVSQVSPSAWGHPKPRLQCHSVIRAVTSRYLEAVAVATGWEPPTQVMPHGAASSPCPSRHRLLPFLASTSVLLLTTGDLGLSTQGCGPELPSLLANAVPVLGRQHRALVGAPPVEAKPKERAHIR